jgi:hypothetical protein
VVVVVGLTLEEMLVVRAASEYQLNEPNEQDAESVAEFPSQRGVGAELTKVGALGIAFTRTEILLDAPLHEPTTQAT